MEREDLLSFFAGERAVTTDSRNIPPGAVFFALKGEKFDGNAFASEAIEKGAALAVVDDISLKGKPGMLWVDNSLACLQELAAAWRDQLEIPVIAICGSNGKTTTKELLLAVLSCKFKCFATRGNLNNHIGVPLSILSVTKDAEIAIIEIGANHVRETYELCQLTKPTHGLVTNNGKDHLEGFGDIEGVRKANCELYDYFREHEGLVFVNHDLPDLMEDSEGLQRTTYGFSAEAEVAGRQIRNGMFAGIFIENDVKIISRLAGDYNAYNLLATYAVAKHFGISPNETRLAIQAYNPSMNRSQLLDKGGILYLMDAYNANPSSMRLALESFAAVSHPHKGAVLGDMLEMGRHSDNEHREILEYASTLNLDPLVLVGPEFGKWKDRFAGVYFDTSAQAAAWFNAQAFDEYFFLVKGSRGIALEKIIKEK